MWNLRSIYLMKLLMPLKIYTKFKFKFKSMLLVTVLLVTMLPCCLLSRYRSYVKHCCYSVTLPTYCYRFVHLIALLLPVYINSISKCVLSCVTPCENLTIVNTSSTIYLPTPPPHSPPHPPPPPIYLIKHSQS
jgi:hypothetical protein